MRVEPNIIESENSTTLNNTDEACNEWNRAINILIQHYNLISSIDMSCHFSFVPSYKFDRVSPNLLYIS